MVKAAGVLIDELSLTTAENDSFLLLVLKTFTLKGGVSSGCCCHFKLLSLSGVPGSVQTHKFSFIHHDNRRRLTSVVPMPQTSRVTERVRNLH